jgi:hypothetical protein
VSDFCALRAGFPILISETQIPEERQRRSAKDVARR